MLETVLRYTAAAAAAKAGCSPVEDFEGSICAETLSEGAAAGHYSSAPAQLQQERRYNTGQEIVRRAGRASVAAELPQKRT